MKSILVSIVAAVLLVTTAFAGPIHDAAKNGDLAGVQAELNKGVDVHAWDHRGRTPLHNAATKEIAELLIAKGADVNAMMAISKYKRNYTPLDYAVRFNKNETADLLRKHGGKTAEELKAEGK